MIAAQNISLTKFPLKIRLISGALIAAGAMVSHVAPLVRFVFSCLTLAFVSFLLQLMFSFVDSKSDYFPLIFPGLIIGAGGAAMAFVGAYVSLLMSVPVEHSGLVPHHPPPRVSLSSLPLTCSFFSSVRSVSPEASGTPSSNSAPPLSSPSPRPSRSPSPRTRETSRLARRGTRSVQFTIPLLFPPLTFPPSVRFSLQYGFIFAMALLIIEAGLVVLFFKDPLKLVKSGTDATAAGVEEKKEGEQAL